MFRLHSGLYRQWWFAQHVHFDLHFWLPHTPQLADKSDDIIYTTFFDPTVCPPDRRAVGNTVNTMHEAIVSRTVASRVFTL